MERKEVSSSTLKTIGYDAAAKILEITFNSGAVYEYDNVPKETADGLLNATSKGGYFMIHVRPCFLCRCTKAKPKKEEGESHGEEKQESTEKPKKEKARKAVS
jgi:hypothetical protein